MDPDILLKEATAKKDAGDINGAIHILKKAYQAIGKLETIYAVNTFLRLPQYLQEAGRNDEAWHEYNLLLTKGYPNQMNNLELMPMDHSIIYDKMRLFLQREGRNDLAVRFGIFSFLSWVIGLHRQARKEELKQCISKESVEKVAMKLLKKAKKMERIGEITKMVEKQTNALSKIDFHELGVAIDKIISQ
ncbi:MAG: hypothetical protein HYX84_02960 [Chloroflexi bacterium]|nr:hypothetical protein [Chloroflexota bacterium]